MSIGTTVAILWIASTAASAAVILPVLYWAVRSGQFADRDHARYLPLLGDEPKTDPPKGAARGGGGDVLP